MKNVLLSADGCLSVYAVPNIVADDLEKYCLEFCSEWLWKSPHAESYRVDGVACYTEEDFIKYLNKWVFPDTPSGLIAELKGIYNPADVPQRYKNCAWFNF